MPDDIRRQARALGDLDKSQINLLIDHLQMVRTIYVDCQVALFCLLGVIATLLSLFLLLPRAYPRDVRAASMLFAMSCTYLGTSALVNVPLARYSSSVAWLVAAGLLLSISGATTYWRNRPS